MKKFLNEFKEFALKGNVLDMAVGVVIGSAFTGLINSLVENFFTPIIGLITPETAFENWTIGPIEIGAFLNAVLSFIILALCVFMVVKFFNVFRKKKEEEPAKEPTPSKEELLLTEIRDLLKQQAK